MLLFLDNSTTLGSNFYACLLARDVFFSRLLPLNKGFSAMIAPKSLLVLSDLPVSFAIVGILSLNQFKELMKNKTYFK